MFSDTKSVTLCKVSDYIFRRDGFLRVGTDPMMDKYEFGKGYFVSRDIQELMNREVITPYDNQGIIAIQNPEFFVQYYFHDGAVLRREKTSNSQYPGRNNKEAKHSFIVGSAIGVDRVAEKLMKCLEWPLHAWGQNSTLIFYAGPHSVRDIGDRMQEFIYSPNKQKCRFFRATGNKKLKQEEKYLSVLIVDATSSLSVKIFL